MKRIIIFSSRGGTGATSVAANLTSALNAVGQSSYVIDMNPQNVLRLHFAMDIHDANGWAVEAANHALKTETLQAGQLSSSEINQAWLGSVYSSKRQVAFAPYGNLDAAQSQALAQALQDQPNLLAESLTPPTSKAEAWQLILLPALEVMQAAHYALCQSADLVLCVGCADFQHYALLPNSQPLQNLAKVCDVQVLLNRVEATASYSRDMRIIFEQELESLVPVYLHQDTSINDALLNLMPVIDYAPYSQAARDFNSLAFWCMSLLNRENFAAATEDADV